MKHAIRHIHFVGIGGSGMNGRYNRVSGQRCFHSGVTLHISHFSHAYNVGVKSERCYD